MRHTMLKTRRQSICPACAATIRFRPAMDDLGTCPRCGEWLVRLRPGSRRLAQLDYEPSTDLDEYSKWEQTLIDKIG